VYLRYITCMPLDQAHRVIFVLIWRAGCTIVEAVVAEALSW
jgi:hypothetical protein